ncbi:MAG: hypothetical protein BYD32DRAFT_420280 [Podila humilis]|nr:MAG: hypothetical protein BYD32DRAFT_420280 [Podila humilis]
MWYTALVLFLPSLLFGCECFHHPKSTFLFGFILHINRKQISVNVQKERNKEQRAKDMKDIKEEEKPHPSGSEYER